MGRLMEREPWIAGPPLALRSLDNAGYYGPEDERHSDEEAGED
jgi:hypothetical protein